MFLEAKQSLYYYFGPINEIANSMFRNVLSMGKRYINKWFDAPSLSGLQEVRGLLGTATRFVGGVVNLVK